MNDTYKIKGKDIVNSNNIKVSSTKNIKKNHIPLVVHKGERIIEKDIEKLKKLEKKYKTKLFPRRKI